MGAQQWSHVSAGKHRAIYSVPRRGGESPAKPDKGEASAASQSAELFSCHMILKVNPVTPLASPLGEEGHEVAKGVQANWIHRGAPRPANPVRRHPAKSVWMVVRMIMTLDMDVTAERRHYNTHRPRGRYHNPRPKGPSNLRTLRTFVAKPRQPSRRGCVQRRRRHFPL